MSNFNAAKSAALAILIASELKVETIYAELARRILNNRPGDTLLFVGDMQAEAQRVTVLLLDNPDLAQKANDIAPRIAAEYGLLLKRRMKVEDADAIIILAANELGLNPSFVDHSRILLDCKPIAPDMAARMNKEAARINNSIANDPNLMMQANAIFDRIAAEQGFATVESLPDDMQESPAQSSSLPH